MPVGSLTTLALGAAMQVGMPAPSESPNFPPLANSNAQYGNEGRFEPRYPFDTQQNWVHGYFQEIPAYSGHVFYRPYNYKDVLSQSQTAAGWGLSPTMPYSQQFWHRYHDQATMLKLSQSAAPGATLAPPAGPVMTYAPAMPMTPAGGWAQPTAYWSIPAQPTMMMMPAQNQQMMQPAYYPVVPSSQPPTTRGIPR